MCVILTWPTELNRVRKSANFSEAVNATVYLRITDWHWHRRPHWLWRKFEYVLHPRQTTDFTLKFEIVLKFIVTSVSLKTRATPRKGPYWFAANLLEASARNDVKGQRVQTRSFDRNWTLSVVHGNCKIFRLVTVYAIFATEMCMTLNFTLTFRMGEDQTYICQTKADTLLLSDGTSNACSVTTNEIFAIEMCITLTDL